ncbi:hypothetical protein DSECCO2_362130 [anaerobic digester metagenome]
MPPVLHVALLELPGGAEQEMLADQARPGVDEGHDVLELVAETESPARLVGRAARPEAAGQGLVQKPAVGEHVERLVRGLDVNCPEGMGPMPPYVVYGVPRRGCAPEAVDDLLRVLAVASHAELEDDLSLLPNLQDETDLDRGARVHGRASLA